MKNSFDDEFIKLFSEYENEMYRIAYIYVRNEADALDVMQEAAYRACKNRASLKDAKYFQTWLIRITINCAVDFIRKNARIVDTGADIGIGSEDFREDESEIIRKLTLEDLMNTLNEDEKSVIILKYYYEYSFREIGDILNRPTGSVKTILYRALGKLRKRAKEA